MTGFGLKDSGRIYCKRADCEKEDGEWGFNLDLTISKPTRRILSCVDCGAKLNVDEYLKRNRKLVKKTIEENLEVENRLFGDRDISPDGAIYLVSIWYCSGTSDPIVKTLHSCRQTQQSQ